MQEVQRQTSDLSAVRAALSEQQRVTRQPAAAAETAAAPASESAAVQESAPPPPAAEQPPASGPRTHPIVLPQVDVAELGVADRLGLSDEGDDEVGPTS